MNAAHTSASPISDMQPEKDASIDVQASSAIRRAGTSASFQESGQESKPVSSSASTAAGSLAGADSAA